ncbi:hypothetical protein RI138_04825 [Streptomyces sp. C11-1]|uniref:Uncharacterized protein n=1 Tax=Streptomyces durocortorensis TaxID=2811104 RepID=A0ABY9VRG4_9ACTN|nr:hypothetical protein [Streptomyces durocortorensis]WNF26190.1 hypothetical protein RI138_04825 [Streptomyces durocortorensis]
MVVTVTEVLGVSYDPLLVGELVESYEQAQRNFYLGGHRLSAVEGGRFCEAAYRLLEFATSGTYTPLGGNLDTEGVTKRLQSLPAANHPKSIRVHIPRNLRLVYDIRNSRDAAHLADGIDPNLQDATLVVGVLDWVLAEFVRLSGGTTPDHARALVEGLVTRRVPVVQDFGEFQKVLRPDLRAGDRILVVLYRRGTRGAGYAELMEWMPLSARANLRRTVRALDEKSLVHAAQDVVRITYAGEKSVESRGLLDPL